MVTSAQNKEARKRLYHGTKEIVDERLKGNNLG
jgi:hypothetical protein